MICRYYVSLLGTQLVTQRRSNCQWSTVVTPPPSLSVIDYQWVLQQIKDHSAPGGSWICSEIFLVQVRVTANNSGLTSQKRHVGVSSE